MNEETEQPHRFYSTPHRHKKFRNITKNHEILTDKPTVKIYANRIQQSVKIKILF